VIIRAAVAGDHGAIDAVTTAAFGGAAEARIIADVRAEGAALVELTALEDGRIVGHILFSAMHCDPARRVAGLGPLAVSPDRQRLGVGSALTRAGLEACRALGVEAVVVLGHPAYYPRFGFSREAASLIASPYAESPGFMALALRDGALALPLRVSYPAAFG
jgi:putative acetyltransferase